MWLNRPIQLFVLYQEVAEMDPEDAAPCLMAARICYERLNLLGEGIEWAEMALER